MSSQKPTGQRVITQDGFSSALLQKGLSSANLQAALTNRPPASSTAQPNRTQGNGSQGTAGKK